MTIHDLVQGARDRFMEAGINANLASLDAEVLARNVLGWDRARFITERYEPATSSFLLNFEHVVARRVRREPISYITGRREFWGLDFVVSPAVLVPRPETELIVEAVLELFPKDTEFSFADVGTGSGCIAISILDVRPRSRAIAIDQSERALRVAEKNAERNGVIDRLRLVHADLFHGLPQPGVFNLIVSNPPYVPNGELKSLQREVQREPPAALAGGADGLDVIRRLMDEAPQHLHANGYLVFEFGINQDDAITELASERVWDPVEVRRDLQQIPRMIILRKK